MRFNFLLAGWLALASLQAASAPNCEVPALAKRQDTVTGGGGAATPEAPQTTAAPPPETTAAPPPQTTAAPPPETTAAPPPETTAAPPPQTTAAPPPQTTAAPPPDTPTQQPSPEPAPVTTQPSPAPPTSVPAPEPVTSPAPVPEPVTTAAPSPPTNTAPAPTPSADTPAPPPPASPTTVAAAPPTSVPAPATETPTPPASSPAPVTDSPQVVTASNPNTVASPTPTNVPQALTTTPPPPSEINSGATPPPATTAAPDTLVPAPPPPATSTGGTTPPPASSPPAPPPPASSPPADTQQVVSPPAAPNTPTPAASQPPASSGAPGTPASPLPPPPASGTQAVAPPAASTDVPPANQATSPGGTAGPVTIQGGPSNTPANPDSSGAAAVASGSGVAQASVAPVLTVVSSGTGVATVQVVPTTDANGGTTVAFQPTTAQATAAGGVASAAGSAAASAVGSAAGTAAGSGTGGTAPAAQAAPTTAVSMSGTPGANQPFASTALAPGLAPGIGQGSGSSSTDCTTSNGLKGVMGVGGCFANQGQSCTVSDGIAGVTSDSGTCSPSVDAGASCTLQDGTKGSAQLQGLGTSVSCIGDNSATGTACSLPGGVLGTVGSDGRTCEPPKTAPPVGNGCPLPGGLGVMQSDGKTCLPPSSSAGGPTAGTAGTSGTPVSSAAGSNQCAVGGEAGTLSGGTCQVIAAKSGDPCYRDGGGAYLSNYPPDGILGPDRQTCLVINDSCTDNGVQGRYSPSYTCVVPPPAAGNPTTNGASCQRGQIWGGRWDSTNNSCILPGDPCPDGIYGPNAVDCIPKPAAGTVCQTAQGFNGTFNDAGLCAATIPPGARTPCISIKTEAGTVSITPNGTLCQIPPTADTPQGLLQEIAENSYCQNGRDSGVFNSDLGCDISQRPGGINSIPQGTRGNPTNDVSAYQKITKKSSPNWIPGVATAAAVVGVALLLGILAKYFGWHKKLFRSRKRRRNQPFGPGEGILEEPVSAYVPQPTYPTLGGGGTYTSYAPTSTAESTHMGSTTGTNIGTNRLSIVSDDRLSPTGNQYTGSYNTFTATTPGSPPGHPGSDNGVRMVEEPLLSNYSPEHTQTGFPTSTGPVQDRYPVPSGPAPRYTSDPYDDRHPDPRDPFQ